MPSMAVTRRGDELPDWVRCKQQRLEHIRAAKAELEAEAKIKCRAKRPLCRWSVTFNRLNFFSN
jgi:hypothetical protein